MKKRISLSLAVLALSAIIFASMGAVPVFASQNSKEAGKNVQRWKPTAIAAAKYYHVYSAFIVTKSLHITAGENGGGEHSKASRACVGAFQFDRGWIRSRFGRTFRAPITAHTIGGHVVKIDPTKGWVKSNLKWHNHPKDWRQCGTCSMYRFMKSYRQGHLTAIRGAWRATFY